MTADALPVYVNIAASLASLARNEHVQPTGMLKLPQDLDRYASILADTRPEVVVETGTRTGASARWFALQGRCKVITVDVDNPPGWRLEQAGEESILFLRGDSAAPSVVATVARGVGHRRCMVSLDSDHNAAHVQAEIEAYAPMVSPGCYLVVEDAIFGYADHQLKAQHGMADLIGSPLDAIAATLAAGDAFTRDVEIEQLHPVTHHPAGWWIRHG